MNNKIGIFRTNIWYEGLYIDEVSIKVDKAFLEDATTEGIKAFYQLTNILRDKGYEIVDHCNNLWNKTEQYTYFPENDAVDEVVYVQYDKETKSLKIGKNISRLSGSYTTKDLIKQIVKLDELYNDVVQMFTQEYGVFEEV